MIDQQPGPGFPFCKLMPSANREKRKSLNSTQQILSIFPLSPFFLHVTFPLFTLSKKGFPPSYLDICTRFRVNKFKQSIFFDDDFPLGKIKTHLLIFITCEHEKVTTKPSYKTCKYVQEKKD